MQILREFLQFFKLFNFFLIKLSQLRFRIFPIYLPSSSTYEAQRCLIEKEKEQDPLKSAKSANIVNYIIVFMNFCYYLTWQNLSFHVVNYTFTSSIQYTMYRLANAVTNFPNNLMLYIKLFLKNCNLSQKDSMCYIHSLRSNRIAM